MKAQARDYYQLLELQPTASVAEIRRAYFRKAKIYHPDRQAVQSDENTEMFLAIQEAYDVLSDAKRRLEYDQGQASSAEPPAASGQARGAPSSKSATSGAGSNGGASGGISTHRGPTLEQEKDARMAYMKAESYLEQGNHEQAARIMRAVARTVPDNPEYLSLAGYLQALEGGDRLHAARDLCQKAVEAQPFNALFLARLGFVYEEVGLRSRAESYYAQALAKNPKQPLALSRQRASASAASSGLLGALKRLFGG